MNGEDERDPNSFGFGRWREEGFEEEYEEDWVEPSAPPGRRRKRLLVVSGAIAGLAVVAYAAVAMLSTGPVQSVGDDSAAATPTRVGYSPSATDPALAAQQTAQAFLTDWQSGNDGAAAALTDSPAAAKAALDAYRTDLNLSVLSLQAQPGDADGIVPFTVAATVSLTPHSSTGAATWDYTSQLTAYSSGHGWLVQWDPTVMAANLTSSTHLMLVAIPPGPGVVTDAKLNSLASDPDPGLQNIAGLLAGSAPVGQGTPGIDIVIADDTGTQIPGIAAAVVSQPVATGNVVTTIDPNIETAAMAAVGTNPQSSMVVLQPSTGYILAIANNDADNDDALVSQIAPGSTMKVVTSAALLNQGLSPDSAVACPAVFPLTNVDFHNSGGESRPAGTEFIDDFAASCNNAFTTQYQRLSGGVLADTAQTYFGLNEKWNIGLGDPEPYFTMPTDSVNSELAAESFGQGTIDATPLAMASVAATVDTGSFHQPILITSAPQVHATALPHSTDSDLWQMMRAVVTYPDGTAHDDGFGSDVYAKTGTADHGVAGATPNSWMIVFDPAKNVAIGCVVLNGDFGAQSAGPEVASVLNAIQ
jgi:Penicillin binding protein transpeptidase domain